MHWARGYFSQMRGGLMVLAKNRLDRRDALNRAARALAPACQGKAWVEAKGYQLNPKDCRAPFLEFNHALGGEDAHGAYWPAGGNWQGCVRMHVARRLEGVEVVSHDPAGPARHWSCILVLVPGLGS
jgi:hypothetical protein